MFDVLTVAAVADELTETLLDGRVQKVGLIDRRTLGFEIYTGRRRYLVASAGNDQARLLLVDEAPSFDSQLVTPLLLLLRKYVRGGLVVGVEQPPLDRVVRLSIAKRLTPHNGADEPAGSEAGEALEDEDDPEGIEGASYVHLVVEIMGRHSNIILVDDDGLVMESIKRVTPAMSRVRPIAPRIAYTPPPSDDRGDPRRLSSAETTVLLGAERPEAKLAKVLPARLRGVSPQMAREIAFAALGDVDATVADARGEGAAAVARSTRHLLEPLLTSAWNPHVYRSEGEVVAFAAVPLRHLAREHEPEAIASMSRAAELALGGGESGAGRHGARRERLVASIREVRERRAARLESLRAERAKEDEAERYRRWGEAIYAYLWAIEPGMDAFEADGERIPLDPSLTAKENAQALFERYRKAQGAGEHLPELIAEVETEIGYLDQLATLAAQAETFPELEDVRVEWDAYTSGKDAKGRAKPRPRSTPPRRTRPLLDPHGNAIYLGRSGAENDRITFDIAGPNDTWLHARGVPGSHVIVRWATAAGDEDEATLELAAALAAYYSSARESGSVEVDITRRRHVRKIKGTGPGMVTYRNERTIAVRPRDERALGLTIRE